MTHLRSWSRLVTTMDMSSSSFKSLLVLLLWVEVTLWKYEDCQSEASSRVGGGDFHQLQSARVGAASEFLHLGWAVNLFKTVVFTYSSVYSMCYSRNNCVFSLHSTLQSTQSPYGMSYLFFRLGMSLSPWTLRLTQIFTLEFFTWEWSFLRLSFLCHFSTALLPLSSF